MCSASNRLTAVCAAGGHGGKEPILLAGILLHEIGHILELPLIEESCSLDISLAENQNGARVALAMVSPLYLGKHGEQILENLWAITKAELAEKETVTVAGESRLLYEYKNDMIDQCTQELFAEMMKAFYLEPAMTGLAPEPKQTGWHEFDDIQNILLGEARFTLQKGISKAVFPLPRRKPDIRFWEPICGI